MNLLARAAWRLPIKAMQELPHTRGCFVCGESNPIGLKLRFETDGQIVRTRFVAQRELAGFRHIIHGGIVGTVLDEIMVWVCAVRARRFAYCGEFTVRFLQPVRPHQPLVAKGELVANRRGRLFEAKAELREEAGELLATATGKYLPLKGSAEVVEMFQDLVGDPRGLFDAP